MLPANRKHTRRAGARQLNSIATAADLRLARHREQLAWEARQAAAQQAHEERIRRLDERDERQQAAADALLADLQRRNDRLARLEAEAMGVDVDAPGATPRRKGEGRRLLLMLAILAGILGFPAIRKAAA